MLGARCTANIVRLPKAECLRRPTYSSGYVEKRKVYVRLCIRSMQRFKWALLRRSNSKLQIAYVLIIVNIYYILEKYARIYKGFEHQTSLFY